ncbi:thiamine phosphate synthase [Nocardioides vastitatis]|uniref:Thiamine phosphate synthase n=1 Tax=Nocardioides vastitatis TaxID=2568655 RepID=A0ABW0ZEL0_9ACTN
MNPPPRLLVLTDRSQLPLGRSLRAVLTLCVEAGLTHVVLREPDLADEQRARLAADLGASGLAVIAAHRPVPGSAGRHLAADQPAPDAQTVAAWGRSCHSAPDIAAAAREGAQWATLSPYAPTLSKPGYGPPQPAAAFAGHDIPVYALGGVSAANAAAARAAGAHGVAVMGAVMRAPDPAGVVAALLREVAA